jgi:hypothetical protein
VNIEGLVEAASAGVVAAVTMGGVTRRYWRRRELLQQAAFTRAVQAIVYKSVVDMIARQGEFEKRQGRHLDRQDIAIAALRRELRQGQRRADD